MYIFRTTQLRSTRLKSILALNFCLVLLLVLSGCTLPQAVVVPNQDGQQEAVSPTAEPPQETAAEESPASESMTESSGGDASASAETTSSDEATDSMAGEGESAESSDADATENMADSDTDADADADEGGESAANSIIAAVSATTVPEEELEEEPEGEEAIAAEAESDGDDSIAVESEADDETADEEAMDDSATDEEGGERTVITVGDLMGEADNDEADDGEAASADGVTADADDADESEEASAALTVGDILAQSGSTANQETTATAAAPVSNASTTNNAATTSAAAAAPVATAVPVYYVEIDSGTNNLNVRAEPNSAAEIVEKLPSGTIVQYFPSESQGEWYKIPQGWIAASFTKAARIDSQPQDGAASGAVSDGTVGSTASSANRVFGLQDSDNPYVVTGGDAVPLRSGPNEAFPAVATATSGRAYEIQGIDRTREWYQVLVPGINDLVWIAAKDVDAIGALNDIPIRSGPSSRSSELPSVEDSDRSVRVPPPTSDPPDASSTLNSSALASTASTPTLLSPTASSPTPVPTQIPQPTQPLPTQPPPTATLTANQNSAAGPQAPAQQLAQPPAQQPSPAQSYPAAPGFFGYGVQAHMLGGGIGQAVNATAEMGFNWIKQQVQWSEFEGSQGALDFSELRRIVDQAGSRNISVLFSVVNAPDWAREPGFHGSVGGPPADPQTMANFVGRLASDFCGSSLKAIEVWNEQNLHYEWGNKPLNPAEYMNLLRASHASIKGTCPSMIVVSGALTPTGPNGNFAMDDFQYLEMMYQNGLASYADAIGAHPSGYNVPPNITWDQACAAIQQTGNQFNGACDNPHHSWSFRSTMEGYRNIMQVYGDADKRIWPTEFGWAADGAFDPRYAYANDNSLEEQKNWTVEAYQMMRNWGWVGPAFLWNLNFRVVANGTEKAQWGIVRNDYSPLPVYNALRAMPK